MTKVKITTLTDKISDDEILSKLKSLGVKVNYKAKEDPALEKKDDDKQTLSGETMIEKRVASTIIRRRVQPPPQKEKVEIAAKETKPEDKKEEVVKKAPKKVDKIDVEKKTVEPQEMPGVPSEEKIEVKAEPTAPILTEREKKGEFKEEALKGDIELIGEEKEKEITKVLEEAYKQDLEKDFTLVEPEVEGDDKKKKKTEKLLKKIEEQEAEETKLKKKGILKRKVVIKEEDLYTYRRQKARSMPVRKDRRERAEERKEEEDKKAELKPARKIVKVGDEIQIGEFAKRMNVKAQDIIKKLLPLGIITTVNQNVDFDTAYLVGTELGFEVEKIISIEEEFLAREEEGKENEMNLQMRPPVVTIMGHVDHGKTLLLDTIRHSKVAEQEAGGITQHIGAYVVDVNGKEIVFVDTPGHEAFTAMRARGAQVTDVVILVVAADDGVMPQTKEAIDHARAAKVPIVVAINKIDKPAANPEKVRKELADLGLLPEKWGGNTLFAEVSAKQKTGIKELLELILLQAEVLELKANPDKAARGVIIEAKLDKGRGPVATVLVQEGTLKAGDPFLAGSHHGRVRAMLNDKGQKVDETGPSTPVEVVGFADVPEAGETFIVVPEERMAKQISLYRQEKMRAKELAKLSKVSLEELYDQIKKGEVKELNVIIKADVQGSIEAMKEALNRLSTDAVKVSILHDAVGGITETDVNLASASNAIIIGFNVRPVLKAQSLAEQEKVDVRSYSIIYDAISDIRKALEGLLEPTYKEHLLGRAQVVEVFNIRKVGTIAGSLILDGKVVRGSHARLLRDNVVVYDGRIVSLRRFKDDVKDCAEGLECGIAIENYSDVKQGDIVESYEVEEIRPRLS